jgi:hypothetical protein
VTDNLPYAKVCAAATFKTVETATASAAVTAGSAALFEDIGGVPLGGNLALSHGAVGVNAGIPVGFEVPPQQQGGEGGGHAGRQGGSFFDRLWSGRGKSNRFFIQGRRLP